VLLSEESILEGDRIPLLESHVQALEQICCFLSTVFCDHGDVPAYFLSQLGSHVVPRAGCLSSSGVELLVVIISAVVIVLLYTVSQKNWDPIKTDCKSDSGSQN